MQEVMPATGVFSLLWLLIALPLVGSAILLLGGRKLNKWGAYLGVFTVLIDAVIAIAMLIAMMGNSAEQRTFSQNQFSWMFAGNFKVDMAF
ncbi:MAG: NADH-quinone oxidoreductase subunit L, partial [Actinobacteria bacterium]|nr:NADH-quinone oxidoreductase subunit L [Actinomycetota bacterium]